ncbi:MAG: hypothetical protein ACYC2H_04795 [Thermoplasmatota archaeon]
MPTPVAKGLVVATIALMLYLTALQFPPPIGFESRPQDDVSLMWLGLFGVILVSELATGALIHARPRVGAALGLAAAVLNVLQVIADQAHLMQPEVAPLAYRLLEDLVALLAVALGLLCWRVWTDERAGEPRRTPL